MARAQDAATGTVLTVTGDVKTPLHLSLDDLRRMPRRKITARNPHEHQDQVYEGVALAEVLKRAGVPQGEQVSGEALTTFVVAEAADGYRVLFSLVETDPHFEDSDILVADTMDGAPLGKDEGPVKLVLPHEKSPRRWIRMVRSLKVETASP
ncbi:MAG TPA: molybdopterin-dependent oxidoreductase [Candidatus Acidoferrales bacterium]|nr:molybdopterin-dependent oxidoreductase [Candidatus Acidoferrales bacterium]